MPAKICFPGPCAHISELAPYVPGRSIDEIREKYGLSEIIKLASNENPLGMPPLAQERLMRHAANGFRYPQGGNPRLCEAIANFHQVSSSQIIVGNGSDELIDLLMRTMANPEEDNIVCFKPCFGIYPVQAHINRLKIHFQPLETDFSFNFDALLDKVDEKTRLVFITTPDNPSGYCPPVEEVYSFAQKLSQKNPYALLVVDEAYMDFVPEEKAFSMLANKKYPENTAFLRTFSKSWGLAGLRIGYAVLPEKIASAMWRARLPFSVNSLAEEAALGALADAYFRKTVLKTVRDGREQLIKGLENLSCKVWPAYGNFIMFQLPENTLAADECYNALLERGIIIRPLKSYELPELLRVSVGTARENSKFLTALGEILAEARN